MPTIVIQPGATIFVTGANGLIGSHITDQLLKRGYNVRGAVRDIEKNKWLAEYFDGKYEAAKFEMVAVPDMTADGCYDNVVKGMLLHITTTFLTNPVKISQVPRASSMLPHHSSAMTLVSPSQQQSMEL